MGGRTYTGRAALGVAGKLSGIALMLYGAATLIVHGLIFAVRAMPGLPSDTEVTGSIKSPDGRFKAVIFNATGSAFDPYCIAEVSIVTSDTPDNKAWGDNKIIFDSGCDGVRDRQNIVWTSMRNLQITFDPNLGMHDVSDITLKRYAGPNGEVRISYVTRPCVSTTPH